MITRITSAGLASRLSARTVAIQKNIALSAFFKVMNIAVGFFITRITFTYLSQEKFGIWMTILSILSWISMLDVGIGNGLRNRLSQCMAVKDIRLGKIYVSTSYLAISIIVTVALGAAGVLYRFIDFARLFNTNSLLGEEIKCTFICVLAFYLLTFLFSLINSVAYARQDSAIPEMIRFITSLSLVIVISLVSLNGRCSLFDLCFSYALTTFLVMFLSSLLLFGKRYADIRPDIRKADMGYFRDIIPLGLGFFILEVTYIIIFATDNMIITQVLGPDHVPPYQLAYKLFSIFSMGFGIILVPLWSGYTDAYTAGDMDWIGRTLKNVLLLLIPIGIGCLIMVFFAKPIIKIWVGEEMDIPLLLLGLMAVYTFQSCWNNVFSYFVNGIGKIRLQMYSGIIGAIANIPLSVYFAVPCGLGSSGVILGTIVSLSLASVVTAVQTFLIVIKKRSA